MKDRKNAFLLKSGIILFFLLFWEVLSRAELVNVTFIPPFSAAFTNIYNLFQDNNLLEHLRISTFRALSGFILAVLVGIPLGLLLGLGPLRLKWAMEPLLEVLVQVNPFILFHIIELILGIGEPARISVIFLTCLWPVVFSTVFGISNVDAQLLKIGRSFNLSKIRLFFQVILPASSPKIFAGLRLSMGYSVFMLVAAEMMGAKSGLGWLITQEQLNFHMLNIFSIALVIAMLGLCLDLGMEFIQKKFSHYKMQEFLNSSEL
ncbi:MAG: ABC transporter permease [Deltaproteobacteria bacterium]|jgi:NitT/TauT family transport system permease protein|nr:ABC transporter permease [Deltaproteobacteria bacterium]